MLSNIDNIRDTIGLRNTYRVRVTFNDNNRSTKQIEGILWKYDGDPPFNIALRPRLVSIFKQRALIETVINLKIFAKYYSNEKEYRTKLQKNI
jgi:hypothetical protein